MGDQINWAKECEEQQRIVARVRALPIDAAWQEVRSAIQHSKAHRLEEQQFVIYEGATHVSSPLPYELFDSFIHDRGDAAADYLYQYVTDPHPAVAGYCIHGLFELEDSRLPDAALRMLDRREHIRAGFGSFYWSGTLGDYARQLRDEYMKDQQLLRDA